MRALDIWCRNVLQKEKWRNVIHLKCVCRCHTTDERSRSKHLINFGKFYSKEIWNTKGRSSNKVSWNQYWSEHEERNRENSYRVDDSGDHGQTLHRVVQVITNAKPGKYSAIQGASTHIHLPLLQSKNILFVFCQLFVTFHAWRRYGTLERHYDIRMVFELNGKCCNKVHEERERQRQIHGYTDSEFASDCVDRKSTGCYKVLASQRFHLLAQ